MRPRVWGSLLSALMLLLIGVSLVQSQIMTNPAGGGYEQVTVLPSGPSTGQVVIVTDDSAVGACDSNAGSAATLCRWDGLGWVAIGDGGGGTDFWPSSAVTKILTWANSFANSLRIGNGTDYLAFYWDATLGGVINCVVGGVNNDCNYTRWLLTGKTFSFLANDGTTPFFTLLSAATSGTVTVSTIDTTLAANVMTIAHEDWWDVAACNNATPSLIFDVPTANSPAPLCDTGSNTQKGHAAFDATTDESFELNWILPTGFTGAIDVLFRWKAVATTGAVGWCAQLIRVPLSATSDPAYPAQAAGNCVSDTADGTTLEENLATISGVTCTSCAAGDRVFVRISRDANGGAVTDDMANDAFLMKVGRIWRVAH